jgi:hypothetical protein
MDSCEVSPGRSTFSSLMCPFILLLCLSRMWTWLRTESPSDLSPGGSYPEHSELRMSSESIFFVLHTKTKWSPWKQQLFSLSFPLSCFCVIQMSRHISLRALENSWWVSQDKYKETWLRVNKRKCSPSGRDPVIDFIFLNSELFGMFRQIRMFSINYHIQCWNENPAKTIHLVSDWIN